MDPVVTDAEVSTNFYPNQMDDDDNNEDDVYELTTNEIITDSTISNEITIDSTTSTSSNEITTSWPAYIDQRLVGLLS